MNKLPKTFTGKGYKQIDKTFFIKYNSLRKRCKDKKNPRYGGRGIACEWNSVWEFAKDMYCSFIEHCNIYGVENTTLDRKDNNGNYCKENCRWVTINEQLHNRKYDEKNFLIGENKYSRQQLSILLGISRTAVNDRYKKYLEGKIDENAFFAPSPKWGISNQGKIKIDNCIYNISEIVKISNYSRDTIKRYYKKFMNGEISKEYFKNKFKIL